MATPGSSSVATKRRSHATRSQTAAPRFQKVVSRRTCNCKASSRRLSALELLSQRDVSISGKKGKEKPNNASGSDPLRRLTKRTKGSALAIAMSFYLHGTLQGTNLLFGLIAHSWRHDLCGIQPDLFYCVMDNVVGDMF